MLLKSITLASLLSTVLAAPSTHLAPFSTFSTFSNVTVFSPPANYTDPQTLYARTVELSNGALLATWENYSPEPPLVYFPIFQSLNGGETWKEISKIQDQVNGWGLRYQPFLYLLPARVGKYPAGTILASGSSIPTDLSKTQIEVYASRDNGYTWEFVSHVAAGGAAIPDNGIPAVWEPFLMYYKGEIINYYSDQRDPKYGQKLVYQSSRNLLNWTAPVDVVVYPTYTDRPGMPTVTLLPNGQYMLTYEFGGGPMVANITTYQFPVYYRLSSNPLDFNSSIGYPLVTDTGIQPTGSPYVTWSPVGGKNGSILVSSGSHSQVFVNRGLGDVGGWKSFATPEGISYTRHLRVLENKNHLLIMGAGILPPANGKNRVTVSVVDLAAGLGTAI